MGLLTHRYRVVAVAEGEAIVDGVIVEGVEVAGVAVEGLTAEEAVSTGVAVEDLTAEEAVSIGVDGEVDGDRDRDGEVRGAARLQPLKGKRLPLTEPKISVVFLLVHMLYVHSACSSALYPCS